MRRMTRELDSFDRVSSSLCETSDRVGASSLVHENGCAISGYARLAHDRMALASALVDRGIATALTVIVLWKVCASWAKQQRLHVYDGTLALSVLAAAYIVSVGLHRVGRDVARACATPSDTEMRRVRV